MFFSNFFAKLWAVYVTVCRSLEAFPFGVRVRSRIAFEHDRGSLANCANSHARPSRISVGTRELYAIQGLGSIFGWLTRPATAQKGLEQGISKVGMRQRLRMEVQDCQARPGGEGWRSELRAVATEAGSEHSCRNGIGRIQMKRRHVECFSR